MSQMPKENLDVVLPCYNPIPGWADKVTGSMAELKKMLPEVEMHLYLVNDGSSRGVTDDDIRTITDAVPNFRYIHYTQNRGKGYALREGISQTQHELCIYTDIDFPYEETSFVAIYNTLQHEKQDIAVGVRNEAYYASVPAARVRISKLLRFMARKMLHLPVNDTQAGLKGFNRKGREVFLQTSIDRYLFDLEFLFLAAKSKSLKIKPVKVVLKPGIVFSRMNSKVLINEGRSFMKIFLSSPLSRIRR